MGLLGIASVPPATVSASSTVLEAVQLMNRNEVGAVAVVEGGKLVGIFTERDLMNRVVLERKDPETAPVSAVMTREVTSAKRDMPCGQALELMVNGRFRHLPIVDDENRVLGMLSLRNILEHAIEDLTYQVDSMVKFFSADGPGGD